MEVEVVDLLGESLHEAAELASVRYQKREKYQRNDLRRIVDHEQMELAQIVANQFIKAARLRDASLLQKLMGTLLEALERRRRKRRQLAAQGAPTALGVSAIELFLQQKRMAEVISFLAFEILFVAFENVMSNREIGDDEDYSGGNGAATFLIQTLPELRPLCPVEEATADDQEEEYDQDGER